MISYATIRGEIYANGRHKRKNTGIDSEAQVVQGHRPRRGREDGVVCRRAPQAAREGRGGAAQGRPSSPSGRRAVRTCEHRPAAARRNGAPRLHGQGRRGRRRDVPHAARRYVPEHDPGGRADRGRPSRRGEAARSHEEAGERQAARERLPGHRDRALRMPPQAVGRRMLGDLRQGAHLPRASLRRDGEQRGGDSVPHLFRVRPVPRRQPLRPLALRLAAHPQRKAEARGRPLHRRPLDTCMASPAPSHAAHGGAFWYNIANRKELPRA